MDINGHKRTQRPTPAPPPNEHTTTHTLRLFTLTSHGSGALKAGLT